ncbi:MAG TPA: DUF456 domain-containing protein [Longimicrobiaceae bacterium]|nr:DUF456 domain-containing protein [Longimicrobiaceae bacterium]
MAYLLLVVAQVLGLALVALGFPGTWLQVAALALFAWAFDFRTVGLVSVGIVLFLAILAEIAEFLLGGHFARVYRGSRRATWGALLGGVVGAFVGLPLPLLGSVLGAMLGAFAGALLFELTTGGGTRTALRAGWGALLGRVVATAMKASVAVVILVFALLTAAR